MKEHLTAAAQANRVGKARLDYYNLTQCSPGDPKAVRFNLRRMDANGRAVSYVCDLVTARDKVVNTEYIGVFYEHRESARHTKCHVRIDYPDGESKYLPREVACDAEWQVFARMAGVRVKTVLDLTDAEVVGVRRISFTVPKTLEQFTIHVAPLV
jgi:hypothetical protein